jgi:hypothetical protein
MAVAAHRVVGVDPPEGVKLNVTVPEAAGVTGVSVAPVKVAVKVTDPWNAMDGVGVLITRVGLALVTVSFNGVGGVPMKFPLVSV